MSYKPLFDLIKPYFDSPLEAIPSELRERVAGLDGVLLHWDKCDLRERWAIARRWDAQFDQASHAKAMAELFNAPSPTPEEAEEYAGANPLLDEIEACEIEIAEWGKIGDQSVPSEKQRKDDALALLNAKLDSLKKQFDVPCGDKSDTKPEPQTAPVVADAPLKPRSNKTEDTLEFEAKVLELMGRFWDEKPPGKTPTKSELCKQVFGEMLRGKIRGKRKFTEGMVRDAAKPWKCPLVVPAFVPDSKFNDKQHPFKA